tara:strand:- start:607 stop:1149 length:543 start_codon:yes stop_codon:yes gene_type:complete
MATQYSQPGGEGGDFAYRKGLEQRYRKKLEDVVSGESYRGAEKNIRDQYRQMGADQLAASNTRNVGALTDVSNQLGRAAATQIGNLELDKTQASIGALESLQAMDTKGSRQAKEMLDFDTMIRKFAEEQAGVYNEQEETANYVKTLLRAEMLKDPKEQNTEIITYLTQKESDIRSGKEDV